MLEQFSEPRKTPSENNGLLLLRLTVGFTLLIGGLQKAFNLEQLSAYAAPLANLNLPPEAAYVVFLFELIAPLMLILGVFSRLAAAFIAVYMLIVIFGISYNFLLVLVPGRGHALEGEIMFLLGSLAICHLGSGDRALYKD